MGQVPLMKVLGIETSCDETAAAVVEGGRRVLSNIVFTQVAKHRPYGGIVPEVACRCHVEELPGIMDHAMEAAKTAWEDLDAVAATYGPGLASSLLVGLTAAKAVAFRLGIPLLGVNHIEAHLYSLFLGDGARYLEKREPLVVLMVSGGHTALFRVDGIGRYEQLGQTLDDAAGEALDKGAKLLGLGYPGGPEIEKAAAGGDPEFVRFPRGLEQRGSHGQIRGMDVDSCFSFSGLKTALLYYLRDHPDAVTGPRFRDVVASYQEAVFEALVDRLERAIEKTGVRVAGCVGGVSRNKRLRLMMERMAERQGVALLLAPREYCTDNAAMVAAVAGAPGSLVARGGLDLDVDPDLVVGSV